MSKLDAWKKKATSDITLPSGQVVTIRLPNLRDCIIAGDIPLPVMSRIEEATKANNGKGPNLSPDELRHLAEFETQVVRATVVAIEGEAVELTTEDVKALPGQDRDELYAYAVRNKNLPK